MSQASEDWAAYRAAQSRVDALWDRVRAMSPAERVNRYKALRAEHAELSGVKPATCVQRGQIRVELSAIEAVTEEERRDVRAGGRQGRDGARSMGGTRSRRP